MVRRPVLYLSMGLLLLPLNLWAFPPLSLVDVPTANTILRGDYALQFLGYDNGGVQARAVIGLSDFFFLGAMEDVEGMIGSEKTHWSIPGVVGKLRLYDGGPAAFSFALGYDTFVGGLGRKIGGKGIYGFYILTSRPFYSMLKQHHFILALRFPIQPDEYRSSRNMSAAMGVDFSLNPDWMVKFEVEEMYFDFHRYREALINTGISYSVTDSISIEFDFQYSPGEERLSRFFKLSYRGLFL